MRKKILLLFGGLALFALGYSQVPKINVSTSSLTDNLAFGDTSIVTFTIKNTGNRDLVYNIDIEGFMKEFKKKDYSDWTLPANHDLILPYVVLARNDDQGIFNLAAEPGYNSGFSPLNTEWVMGKTKDHSPGDYGVWIDAVSGYPPSMVNHYTSMHAIDRDIYYDIFWKSWTDDGNGDGFAYTRYEVPFWIKVINGTGSIAPTQTDTIKIVFDARVTNNTIRQATIKINSNDPVNGTKNVSASLTVTGDPVFELTDTVLSFDNTYVGSTSSLTFQIWNMGVGTLNVTGITNKSSVFTTVLSASSIITGHSEIVTVSYKPTAAILYEDTLVVTTNDPDHPILKVAVSGTGEPVPNVAVTPVSISKPIVYGSGHSYENMDTIKLVISNTGANDLNWQAYVCKAASTPVFFEKADNADYTLPANQDRITNNVWLTRKLIDGLYNAAAEDGYTGQSPVGTMWYNGYTATSNSNDYEVGLENVFGNLNNLPGNTLSMYLPETKRYFDVAFQSWDQTGTGGGFSYTRVEAVNWLLLSDYDNIVAPADADTILVLFNPQSFKTSYDAQIVLTTNVPGKESIVIPVHYTVSGPSEIQTDVNNYDFGDVFITGSSTLKIRMNCMGASPLVISTINHQNSAYTLSSTAMTIAQDSSKILTVTFTPTAVQIYKDTLVIISNALSTPTLKIPLSGNGLLAPILGVSPLTMAHNLVSGAATTDTLIISNTGGSNLEWNITTGITSSPLVTFTKKDYADFNLPINQDRITNNVWITRKVEQGLFNIAIEDGYSSISPRGTTWYDGITAEADPLNYGIGLQDVFGNLGNLPGNTLSMYLPDVKKYYDVTFNTWTQSGNGGGFSYTRREAPIWLSMAALSGTVIPGDADTVIVYIDADMVASGSYSGEILVSSNAPVNKSKVTTVNLTVTGAAEIAVDSSKLGFGNAMIGYAKTVGLVIKNTGSSVLNITNIAGKTGRYVAEDPTITIPAWDSVVANIIFTPLLAVQYLDTLTITSNDGVNPKVKVAVSGTGIPLPEISVTPNPININLFTDSVYVGKIFVENNGASDLIWKISDQSIDTVLLNLNKNYQKILNKIPSIYNFMYDGGIDNISDGGNDMYDGGNYMTTDVSISNIPYSDNMIVDGSSYFGANSKYFTRHFPGLFVMVADVNNINQFTLNGNNGADGQGNTDTTKLELKFLGKSYQGFLRRVYNAGDPSINQMIIIEKNANSAQTYSTNTNNGFHQVSGLDGTSRVYYILYAGGSGLFINNTDAASIMKEFLTALQPGWISFDKLGNTISAGGIDTISYTIHSEFLPQGTYSTKIYVVSNDPVTSEIAVPITLQYGGILVVNPLADVLRNQGFATWSTAFTNVFVDQQNDPLTYIVVSSDVTVVTAGKTGTTLNIAEAGVGKSIITIRAADNNGNVAYEDFNFEVNGLLKVANPIADLTLDEGFGTRALNLTSVFSDPDNSPFTITAVSGNTSVATVSMSGKTLTITEVGLGTTAITVTASDGKGDQISDEFNVTIKVVVGINTPEISVALMVYPNPTKGLLNLKLNGVTSGEVTIMLYDVRGQLVYNKVFNSAAQLSTLDLSILDDGIYFMSVQTGDLEFKEKIILE